jgi:hypothetical protein
MWAGVLGPTLAWTIHLGVGYLLVTVDCLTGLPNAMLWLIGLSVATLGVDLGTGLIAYRSWRLTGIGVKTEIGGGIGRSGFLALFGALSSLLFGFAIVFGTIMPFVLEPCYEILS